MVRGSGICVDCEVAAAMCVVVSVDFLTFLACCGRSLARVGCLFACAWCVRVFVAVAFLASYIWWLVVQKCPALKCVCVCVWV